MMPFSQALLASVLQAPPDDKGALGFATPTGLSRLARHWHAAGTPCGIGMACPLAKLIVKLIQNFGSESRSKGVSKCPNHDQPVSDCSV
jgi:hypothetical protein